MKNKIVRKKRNVKRKIDRGEWDLIAGTNIGFWDKKAKECLDAENQWTKADKKKLSHSPQLAFNKIESGIIENLAGSKSSAVRQNGNAPAHYSHGKYTPWEIVDDWRLDYYCGNALKYVCRHKHKGTPVQDIQKAIDCLIKYKANLEKEIV